MRVLIGLLMLVLGTAPAAAATTVYSTGVYAQSGVVTNAAGGIGAANGSAAGIGGVFNIFFFTIGQAGQAVYSFAQPLSGANVQLTALAGPGAPQVRVSIGEIVGGVAVYSTELAFTGGAAGLFALDLSTRCAAISSTGCSLLRIRTIGGFGGGVFNLDGVSGVAAAPEPAMWALMLMGFGAVAWRLKQQRVAAVRSGVFAN
ncbi:MAG: PEP-CTERM sorting domain-containing protein [Pseudomonadota bacterium]